MVKVTINNSICQIEGLNGQRQKEIKKVLSYKTKKNFGHAGGKFSGFVRYLITNRGLFPTGLLYLVRAYLAKHAIRVQYVDRRVRPQTGLMGKSMFVSSVTPYPEQCEAADAADKHGRGIITAPTGCGKSMIAAMIIDKIQVRTLLVVPSVELKNQTIDGLREAFGADMVGPLVRGRCKHFVTVENVDALESLQVKPEVDMVIIDEFHRSGAATYRKLNRLQWDHIYFKFGLTATPFRSRDEERLLLESVLSKVIYRIDYRTAVEKGYIAPLEVYYVELPKMYPEAEGYQEQYKELVVEREDRNKIISQAVQNLVEAGISILVLTKHIEHGERLKGMLEEAGIKVPFAEGKNQDNKQLIKMFNAGELVGLTGTVGVMGEGIDTKRAEWVILAGGGKSKNQFMQNIGRVFRRFPGKESGKVLMFKDPSTKWQREHFSACVKYLDEEYGIVPARLDLAA